MNSECDIELLERFIHDNTELEQLEEIADDFNIFTALDVVSNEIRHSTFLSWLLNPNESHGFGDYFLSSLLKQVAFKASALGIEGPAIFDIDSWSFDEAEILREWRDVDILVRSEVNRFVCAIENKVQSTEHGDQLSRYESIVSREFAGYQRAFVYLTVEGETPTEGAYVPLSYGEIVTLVKQLRGRKESKAGPEIMAFVSDYEQILRRYIVADSDIQEICRKIYKRHKKALDLIFEYKPDKLMEIHDHLIEIVEDDATLVSDASSKSYIRFIARDLDIVPKEGEGWTKTKRMLLFEFKNTPKGVHLHLIIGPGPQHIRQRLYEIAQGNLTLFNLAKRKLTKQWLTIFKKTILTAKGYEDKEGDELRHALEERISIFKDSDLPRIAHEIQQFNAGAAGAAGPPGGALETTLSDGGQYDEHQRVSELG